MHHTFFAVILLSFFSLALGHVQGCVKTNGKQYLRRAYNMTDFIKRPHDDISLQFKTSKPNGLLLYVKGGPTSYILLKLHNGNIVFGVDFGTGNVSATVPSASLNDLKWHKVDVTRRWKNVTISVDDLSQMRTEIPLNVTQLRLKLPTATADTAMYIFGGPSDIRYPVNFKGVINDLVINGMKPIISYVLKDPNYSLHGSGKLSKYYCYPDLL